MAEIQSALLHETSNSLLYLQEEEGFPRPVVVKILKAEYPSPQRIIQFNNEYEFTKNLNIPGIRRAFRSEKKKGRYALVLEYIEGQTLKEAFTENKQPPDVFLKTAIATADALHGVHLQGIIHKDINGRNVLVNLASGAVTIIDFGISSKIDIKSRNLGNPDKLEGSLAYISPEQTGRMNRVVDYRTDLYSLGVTFYEMLTGRLPFQANDSLEMVHCHIAKIPKPASELNPAVPKPLSDIVAKLMAKNAEDRYQSAYGLKVDLQHCLESWEKKGVITPFELGQRDYSGKFQIPQKLYGRKEELSALMRAFARTAEGGIEMLLVAGYSGVGKSALIHEVHKPITEKRGYFISGKYDQYQRNIPYFAIRQAFNEFCNLLLTENDQALENWKQLILDAVGTNGKVLTDVIPHLGMIIGEQPPVEKLEALEANARFNLVFQKFLRVVCSAEHPLVLFIDDLQWADNASLNLLRVLLTDEQNQYLLILGAYRDNETDPTHPLMIMLGEAAKDQAAISTIHLAPLSFENVWYLTADALSWTPEEAGELAGLIFSKTQGNAFFTVEFLKSLQEKGLIRFDFDLQLWTADLPKIKHLDISDNVVELMAGKLSTLPAGTQEALKFASCIGNWFDLKVLSIIFKKNLIVTLAILWKAVEEGLIFPENDNYKLLSVTEEDAVDFELGFEFLHDRVQQAAYSLIDETERNRIHWHIGQLLLENAGDLDEHLFDIVNQLNAGKDMVADDFDRITLAELNLWAGQKAKNAAAYRSSLDYLQHTLDALKESDWEERYALAFDAHRTAAEVHYLNGNLEESEVLTLTCLEKAKTPLEKSDIYYILMLRQSLSSLYNEAIETARKGLKLLGFHLPETDLEQHIQENMGWLVTRFGQHGMESIFNHPDMTEAEKLATIKILDNLSMPTYVSGQTNLWILHVLLKVRLSIHNGNSPETGYAFSELGLIFCILGNWQLAFQCGDLSKRLTEKFELRSLRHKSRAFHLIANYISPWRLHYRETAPLNNESYRTGLESGEVIFVGYTLFHPFYNQFYTGDPPLQDMLERTTPSMGFAKKIKHDLAFNTIRAMRMFLLNLMGLDGSTTVFKDDNLTESHFIEECSIGKDYYSICAFKVFKAKILFLYREFEAAWETLEQAKATLAVLSGHAAGLTTYTYTQTLLALSLYEGTTPEQRLEYLELANANLAQFKTWSDNCPGNFAHKRLLIEAELARVQGKALEAINLYNEAIASAQRYGFLQEEALANELAARFLLENKVPQYARPHLLDARHGYLRWGAARKAALLEAEFYDLLATEQEPAGSEHTGPLSINTSQSTSKELDMVSVVKASQTLSGEIVLEQLLRKMMRIVLENAGAQKAVLVLKKRGEWFVEAVGNMDKEDTLLPGAPVGESKAMPLAILHYLLHTKETLVIDDVTQEDRFARDPYILEKRPSSILAMPLLHQGVMKGILYLEHRFATSAFLTHRVETLRLLSSQMAVSLQNAQLYNHLQDLNQAYARFVPREFLRTLGYESILDVRLGDQKALRMTVLFSDIRSYTSMSEKMTPEENFDFINAFLQRIGPNITQNGGFINQYLGDGIMALFPEPENAVNAAIGMQLSLNAYNLNRIEKGRPPVRMGIGMHTGNLMLGVIGDPERHDVGVISDVVNAAARLEGLTKVFGASVIISDATLSGIRLPEAYDHRFLGKVQVKGKAEILSVFEFFGGDEPELVSFKKQSTGLLHQGLEDYFGRRFAEAAVSLKKVRDINPADKVADYYLRNAAKFMIEGVANEWTGVEKMEEK